MYAKQSTAKTFILGPALDADGVADTGVVVGAIKVTKNGTVGAPNGSSTLTHDHTGNYKYAANAGDVDTLGEVTFSLNDGTTAMAPRTFQVVPANIYDSLVSGSDSLEVDTVAISGDTTAANNLEVFWKETGTSVANFVNMYDGTGYAGGTTKLQSDLTQILAHTLTDTGTQLADGFQKFFDVSSPTGTVNSLPDAVAGATGGVFIAGTNAATTVTSSFTTTFTGDLTGNVDGNVQGDLLGRLASDGLDNITAWTVTITGNLIGTVSTVTTVTGGATEAKQNTAQTDLDTITGADGVFLASSAQPAGWPANIAASAGQIIKATVDTVTNGHTPTTTVFQADDITEATADHYNGRIVIFTGGALAGQATDITDYALVGGIGQFTVTALTEAPSNNDTFVIV